MHMETIVPIMLSPYFYMYINADTGCTPKSIIYDHDLNTRGLRRKAAVNQFHVLPCAELIILLP